MPGVDDYGSIYDEAGKTFNVDPALLRAIVSVESGGNPNAIGPKTQYGQAVGVTQLLPSTTSSLGVTNPTDPKQAIFGTAKLLDENLNRYPLPQAIMAYYGGTNKRNWGPKTQDYLTKVTAAYKGYKAPMPAQAQQSDSGDYSDQDLISMLAGKMPASASNAAPTSPAMPANTNAPSNSSGDYTDAQLMQMLGVGTQTVKAQKGKASPSVMPAPAAPQSQPGLLGSLGAGAVQGARDVVSSLDPVASWLQHNVPIPESVQTLGGLLPSADEAHANNVAARGQFNQQYGNSVPATIGRIGGEVAASAPALSLGGEIAAGAKAIPYVGRAAEAAGDVLANSKLGRLALNVGKGAAQGAGIGLTTSGASDEPVGQQVKEGAEFGGFLGGAAPIAYKAGRNFIGLLSGSASSINPVRAGLAQTAIDKFDIPLRWSQISQTPFAKYLDSVVGKLPLSGMEKQNEMQREAFSRGVASTFGEDSNALTQDVMARARTRIGNEFDRVAQNTTITPDASNNMLEKFADIESEASQVMPGNEYAPIKNQMDAVMSKIGNDGTIDGKTYQALTRKGAPLDRAANSRDPNIRHYAGAIKSALDDALQESAAPEDAAALQTARLQWKNMRTVQDLAAKAGIEGEISPAALLGAVKKSYKDMAYSGAGDIGNLARIGQEFLKEPPSSGTGERMITWDMLRHGPGALLTGLAGVGAYEAPETAIGVLGGTLLAGHTLGSVLKSKILRDRLLNSALNQPGLLGRLSNDPALQSVAQRLAPYMVPAGVALNRNASLAPPQ